jgi:hypothetical protein
MATKTTFSRVKKRRQPKALLWAIVFLLALVFLLLKVWPAYKDIAAQSLAIDSFQAQIPKLLSEKDGVLLEQQKLEAEFYELARPFELYYSKLLPETIDPTVYSKVFELYTLQQSILEDFPFEIRELSFSESTDVDRQSYKSTVISIQFSANEKILRDFVLFLQTGDLSDEFHVAADSGIIDTRAYKFIMKHGFPIAQIVSFDSSTEDEARDLLNVSMTFQVFSKQ